MRSLGSHFSSLHEAFPNEGGQYRFRGLGFRGLGYPIYLPYVCSGMTRYGSVFDADRRTPIFYPMNPFSWILKNPIYLYIIPNLTLHCQRLCWKPGTFIDNHLGPHNLLYSPCSCIALYDPT